MDERRPKCRLAPALVFAGILSAMLVYLLGYFCISDVMFCGSEVTGGEAVYVRTFDARWQCMLYCPAARVEAAARGSKVSLYYQDVPCVGVY